MSTFTLKLITPNKELFNGNIVSLQSMNAEGGFEIFANHEAYLTTVVPTMTKFVEENGTEHKLFTSTGVIDFNKNELIFCCDAAEWPEDINIDRAKEAKERAEKRLKSDKDIDVKRAKLALARALARIDIGSDFN